MAIWRRRALAVLAAVSLAWVALGWRLWVWQVQRGPALARVAVDQRMLALPLRDRGQILDRRGVPLTDPQPRPALAVFPPLVSDPAGAARELAPLLRQPAAELEQQLGPAAPDPFWLDARLGPELARSVGRLGLPGLAVAVRTERYGPGSVAHHLVGYVNRAGGQLGLEAAWDQQLRGEAGPHLAAYLDAARQPLAGLGIRGVEVTAGKSPWDLHLTLDARVQAEVEAVLDAAVPPRPGAPLRAAVVVLDLRGGEVTAMASRPDFDPARGPAGADASWHALYNRAAVAYPPGSVFKPLVAAVAIEEGLASLDDVFECNGHYQLGGARFTEPKAGGHGRITLGAAIVRSCNIAFIQLGYERMGRDRLLAVARRFGLGEPSGLGLHLEDGGHLPDPQYGGEVVQLAFGQGLEVTPLQLARAYAALAAAGRLPALSLVRKVTGPRGEVMHRPRPVPARRAVGAAAAAAVAGALAGVTDPDGDGTGRNAWLPGWGSAGKTGTAQAVVAGRPATHAWFAGWVPLKRPRYAIVVLVEDGASGGDAAAPLFQEIAGRVLAVGELP